MRPHELGKQIEEARLDLQALLYPGGPRVPHADVDPDDYEHLRQSIRLSGEAVLLLAPQGEQPDVVAATSLAREASTHLDVLLSRRIPGEISMSCDELKRLLDTV